MADLQYEFKGKIVSFESDESGFIPGVEHATAKFESSFKYKLDPYVMSLEMTQDVYDDENDWLCTLKTEAVITVPGLIGLPAEELSSSLIKVAMKFSMDNVISELLFYNNITLDPVPELPSDESVLAAIWSGMASLN